MNYDETFTTLQFASRAIKIKVDAHINEKVEMKKIKEKLIEYSKIKQVDPMSKSKKDESESSEVKSNLKKDLKRGSKIDYDEENQNGYNTDNNPRRSRSPDYSNNRNSKFINSNSVFQNNSNLLQNEKEDYTQVTKKFRSLILHLQGELAKSIITINGLEEENKILREKLSKNY